MELWRKDDNAHERCRGKRQQVVALVQQNLARASVVEVESVPEKGALRLTTAAGSILVNEAITTVLEN